MVYYCASTTLWYVDREVAPEARSYLTWLGMGLDWLLSDIDHPCLTRDSLLKLYGVVWESRSDTHLKLAFYSY